MQGDVNSTMAWSYKNELLYFTFFYQYYFGKKSIGKHTHLWEENLVGLQRILKATFFPFFNICLNLFGFFYGFLRNCEILRNRIMWILFLLLVGKRKTKQCLSKMSWAVNYSLLIMLLTCMFTLEVCIVARDKII